MLHHPLNRLMLPGIALLALLTSGSQAQTPQPRRPVPAVQANITRAYGKLPLAFEANRGQTDPRVRFLAHTPKGTLILTDTEAVLTLPQHQSKGASSKARFHEQPASVNTTVLCMKLVGANRPNQVCGKNPLPGTVNYFRGRDPKGWHTHIPTYGKAAFADVYPGVDMVYYGTQDGRLEYDFVVQPGADPKRIKLALSGARHTRITKEGDLALTTAAGEMRWHRPRTYQVVAGRRQRVACSYRLEHRGGMTGVRFAVANYDRHRRLVIDPTLQYSTYLGGSGGGQAYGIAVDGMGNAYVAGTAGSDFPVTAGAIQTESEFDRVCPFVSKLNATGTALVYSTYLGTGFAYGIAVDDAGNAYLTGNTFSSLVFPVTAGAFQTKLNGPANAFVTKLNTTGTALIYSTLLGGSGFGGDSGYGIAVDSAANAYVTGSTTSSDFPVTTGAFQPTLNTLLSNGGNAFVTKLNATGSALIYSTFLGGSGKDQANGITIDKTGNAYVAGYTSSSDFPVTTGAFQTTNDGYANGDTNAFVTKLNARGSALIYSTFLGGSGNRYGDGDQANGIAIDSVGNAYVAGSTGSSNFPLTSGAVQTTFIGYTAAFVTKLNAKGSTLTYSTFLGGSNSYSQYTSSQADGIAVDGGGNAYVAGYTSASDFPVTSDAFQVTRHGYTAAFVTKLNAMGSALIYSTYLGGSDSDQASGIAVDGADNAYVTGLSYSPDFPVTAGAFQTMNNNGPFYNQGNAFVSKFAFTATTPFLTLNISPGAVTGGTAVRGTITFSEPTPSGGITLKVFSPSNLVILPRSIRLPAGITTRTFNISTRPTNTDILVPITVSDGMNSATADLYLAPSQAPVVSFLTLSPGVVQGGLQNSLGTVTLTSAAPSGGISVNLSSSNTNVAQVAASVAIPAGRKSAQFRVKSLTVTTQQTVIITGGIQNNPINESAVLTVTP